MYITYFIVPVYYNVVVSVMYFRMNTQFCLFDIMLLQVCSFCLMFVILCGMLMQCWFFTCASVGTVMADCVNGSIKK